MFLILITIFYKICIYVIHTFLIQFKIVNTGDYHFVELLLNSE